MLGLKIGVQNEIKYYLSDEPKINSQLIKALHHFVNSPTMYQNVLLSNIRNKYNKKGLNKFLKWYNIYARSRLKKRVRGGSLIYR